MKTLWTSITNLISKNRISKATPVLNQTLLSIGLFLLKIVFEVLFSISQIATEQKIKIDVNSMNNEIDSNNFIEY